MQHSLFKLPVAARPALIRDKSVKVQDEPSEFPLSGWDVFWVAVAAGLVAAHAARFSAAGWFWDWPTLLVLLAAMPVADFVSGCIHWFFDTWGSEQTFFIGPRMIKPFRVHHTKPRNLLATHFFTTNSDASMANIPLLVLAFFIPLDWQATQLLAVFVAATGMFGLPTSQIHKWAHMTRPPRVVRWLQDLGLILGRTHHDSHHAPPHTDNYCITTGWCNPVLSRLGFWKKVERVVTAVTGLKPRAEEEAHAEVGAAH